MRVLVATTAGEGHFGPVVPFATALRDAGHEVRVAAPASFEASVRRPGLDFVALPDAPPGVLGEIFGRLAGLPLDETEAIVFKEVFCGVDARTVLPTLQGMTNEWQPDLILREVAEFASHVVAQHNRIPETQVALSLTSMEVMFRPLVDEPLQALGLQDGASNLRSLPRLTLVPASFDDDVELGEPSPHRFRYQLPTTEQEPLPDDWWSNTSEPLVYMTFGSVTASLGFYPHFYRAVLDGVSDLPIRVLLTLGSQADSDRLGAVPANVHVERWFPQEQVMPHAAAIIGHGGFGTTMLALSAGVPLVSVPLFTSDQHANAGRVQAIGAGVTVRQGPEVSVDVRQALEKILSSDAHRASARRVADDIESLPHPSACVPILEEIAARR